MDALDLNDIDSTTLGVGKPRSTEQSSSFSSEFENSSKTTLSSNALPDIRSSAVVTYSASKYPAFFSHLAPQTNLNLAPSNWLRSAPGLRPDSLLSGKRSKSAKTEVHNVAQFSSLSMADSHIRIMDQIDVVSDAENVKKLMKVSYSKSRVSMAVHRVGKTLLLEKFDPGMVAGSHTNDESKHNWLDKVCDSVFPALQRPKKKLPSAQHDRVMLSKFLYYSMSENASTGDGTNPKQIDIQSPSSSETSSKLHELDLTRLKEHGDIIDDGMTQNILIPAEQHWRPWTQTQSFTQQHYDLRESFERTILWKFDDLQMLLGTNMPIFGRGEYPAVSLRLRDSNKPINILTGIDYWLDNLICNVPEVVMCFHVNGIVQNYEVIKTEELPKLENSKFNPQVIRDIAQNILSFLKSNCTQEGHTYWLFKGSNDDVVKLYDLTMLCDQKESAGKYKDRHNPFTIPVASLLYKMSINLMQQTEKLLKTKQTIIRLLKNCVSLLENKMELAPVMLLGALCMLSTLCLPNARPVVDNAKQCDEGSASSSSIASDASDDFDGTDEPSSAHLLSLAEEKTISIAELSVHRSYAKPSSDKKLTMSSSMREGCETALLWITKGLKVLRYCGEVDVEWSDECLDDIMAIHTQLIRNTTLVYFHMADQAFEKEDYGASLRCIDRALHSYEYLEQLNSAKQEAGNAKPLSDPSPIADILQGNSPPYFPLLLSKLLALCGNCHLAVMEASNLSRCLEQYEALTSADELIKDELLRNFKPVDDKYRWMTLPVAGTVKTLSACRSCYESALSHLRDVARENDKESPASDTRTSPPNRPKASASHAPTSGFPLARSELLVSISRKAGHIANEQGALELNEAVEMLGGADKDSLRDKGLETKKLLWKSCFAHFEFALNSFASVGDVTNQALVLSNMGRLMRICAQSIADSENEEFTPYEQNLYDNAIEYYQKALAVQQGSGSKDSTRQASAAGNGKKSSALSVHDNVSWELSSTYFALAQRLQDHAPLHIKTQEEIERQISNLMSKSLKSCSHIWKNTDKWSTATYRCGQIHARLASLHHNSFRNATQTTKRRQYRSLAESQYSKACSYLVQLVDERPAELLRVQLERLALKEQQIASSNNSNERAKTAAEAVACLSECTAPLDNMKTFLENNLGDNDEETSYSVDPLSQCDVLRIEKIKKMTFSYDLDEWSGLAKIVSKIVLSLLLLLLKSAQPPSSTESTSKKNCNLPRHLIHVAIATHDFCAKTGTIALIETIRELANQIKTAARSHLLGNAPSTPLHLYKELYSRALRGLQGSSSSFSEKQKDPEAKRRSALLDNIIAILIVLEDIARAKLK